jgi:hypothetical protein
LLRWAAWDAGPSWATREIERGREARRRDGPQLEKKREGEGEGFRGFCFFQTFKLNSFQTFKSLNSFKTFSTFKL